jgi:hypothetical protein
MNTPMAEQESIKRDQQLRRNIGLGANLVAVGAAVMAAIAAITSAFIKCHT